MKLKEFDYNLPPERIAQEPIKPRDHSRLLILDRKTGKIQHKHFYDLPDFLVPGDVLVLNNSKVFPARLIGEKALRLPLAPSTSSGLGVAQGGGRIEVFLLKACDMVSSRSKETNTPRESVWECLVGGHRKSVGTEIEFKQGLKAEIIKKNEDGTWEVKFNKKGKDFMKLVEKIGEVPLPPYIRRQITDHRRQADEKTYQTVYADDKRVGSVAAPTAGFHFTPELIRKLKKKGIQFEYVTLHVGLGTFKPVQTENIKKHKMHSEMIEIDKATAVRILQAKKESRRIIAVGTTSVRTLESVLGDDPSTRLRASRRQTDIFIYPGYKFKIVDAMITNFHLPKSTLLMLVSAFCSDKNGKQGLQKVKKSYQEAIRKKYRFFSYGDAMFIF